MKSVVKIVSREYDYYDRSLQVSVVCNLIRPIKGECRGWKLGVKGAGNLR